MINKIYSDRANIEKIRCEVFLANESLPSAQLPKFFTPDSLKKLQILCKKAAWKKKQHPIEYQYMQAPLLSQMKEILKDTFAVGNKIAGKKLSFTTNLLKLSHTDFTLLHDDNIQKPGIDIVIDLTRDWPAAGGLITYFVQGSHIPIPASENSVAIVQRKKGVQHYIKYVNNTAKKPRYIIIATSKS